MHFRLRSLKDQVDHLIRTDIKIDGSTIFVFFALATEGWPFTIENDSDYTVSLRQTVSGNESAKRYISDHVHQTAKRNDGDPPPKANAQYTLKPRAHLDYAWDQPSARDKSIELCINDGRRVVDIMEIGDLVPFRFHVGPSQGPIEYHLQAFLGWPKNAGSLTGCPRGRA